MPEEHRQTKAAGSGTAEGNIPCWFLSPLLDDVHFAEPNSLCKRITYASFAMQSLIELGTINAVALRKGDLTSLAFDCCLQQMNNVIILKYMRAPAQTARGRNDTYFGLGNHVPVPHCPKS
jgi:hypothetical protein